MSKFSFGRASLQRLSTVSSPTSRVCYRALGYGALDFSVICGHRSEAEQNAAFDAGLSEVRWPDSCHNAQPSRAVDLYPYHPRFKSLTGSDEQIRDIAAAMGWSYEKASGFIVAEYHRLAGAMYAAAAEDGVPLRWGGDWDSDADTTDQTFMDLCHFEVG